MLGLITMAAGWLLLLLSAVVWWPDLHDYEWPGLVPVIVILGGGSLILLGHHLWRRPPSDRTGSI